MSTRCLSSFRREFKQESLSLSNLHSQIGNRLGSGGRVVLLFDEVPEGFLRTENVWRLRLAPLDSGHVLLETRGLIYTGHDAFHRAVFGSEHLSEDGYARLALLSSRDPEYLLDRALEALGWV